MLDIKHLQIVAGITIICYLIGMGCKAYNKIPNKWIPIIVGGFGGVLGLNGLYIMPNYPVHNGIDAVAVGIVSGLASTGIDQIKKQLTKD